MALTECGPQHIILYNFIFIYSNTYSFDGGWWRLDGWWSRGPSTSKDLSFAICSRSMLAMPLSVSGGGGSSPHNVWLDIMFVLNLNKIVQIENEQCRIFFCFITWSHLTLMNENYLATRDKSFIISPILSHCCNQYEWDAVYQKFVSRLPASLWQKPDVYIFIDGNYGQNIFKEIKNK